MTVRAGTAIALRPVQRDDTEFLRRLYASTRAEELALLDCTPAQKDALLRMQFDAQQRHYQVHYPDARFDVVLHDGEPVGRLYVRRGPATLHIIDISLMPAHCGRGLGRALLEALLDEAGTTGRRVSVHVERTNRARRLYERLGFAVVGEPDGMYLAMEWTAAGQPKIAS